MFTQALHSSLTDHSFVTRHGDSQSGSTESATDTLVQQTRRGADTPNATFVMLGLSCFLAVLQVLHQQVPAGQGQRSHLRRPACHREADAGHGTADCHRSEARAA
jgi:hypothetical protein